MTAQTTDVYTGNLRPDNSDELDVRRYLLILVKWWREILVITILAGAIGGGYVFWTNSNRTPVYSASADVLIARLFSNIELDPRVSTSGTPNVGDVNTWRASLLTLAESTDIAVAVLDEIGDDLPTSLQSPGALVRTIEPTVPLGPDERTNSNMVRISATTSVPETSAKIANSWAKHFVAYVNGLYGEVPATMIESVTAERDKALQSYQASEKQYEEFLANNQIDMLTRQIAEKSTLRNQLMLNYTRMVTAVVTNEYEARLDYYESLTSTPLQHATALVEAQSTGNVAALELLYNLRASAIMQLSHARTMEQSLIDGGEAAAKSNLMALQMLKLAAFATLRADESMPLNVGLAPSEPTTEMTLDEQLADVRALVSVLETSIAEIETEIAQFAASNMLGADLPEVGGLMNPAPEGGEDAPTVADSLASNDLIVEAYQRLLNSSELLEQLPIDSDATLSSAHQELLVSLEGEIRTLQAALAAQNATQRQLTHQRDLAWTTYDTVGNKLQELTLLRSSANTEVRLGNPAIVPSSPHPKASPVLPVAATTLLGFFGAVILALVVESLGGDRFFARRTATA